MFTRLNCCNVRISGLYISHVYQFILSLVLLLKTTTVTLTAHACRGLTRYVLYIETYISQITVCCLRLFVVVSEEMVSETCVTCFIVIANITIIKSS